MLTPAELCWDKLRAPAMRWSSSGIGGTGLCWALCWGALPFPGGGRAKPVPGRLVSAFLLGGHEGLEVWAEPRGGCLGTTSLLRPVRVRGRKKSEAAENQLLVLCSSEALSNL